MPIHDNTPRKKESSVPAEATTVKSLFGREDVQKKFNEMLGKKASGFISSVIQTISSNKLLSQAKPETVLNAAAMAASLDLPINHNLGLAWIVPYKKEAQFQLGWKGFVQLALRTGRYKNINVIEVHENQFNSFNSLTEEIDCDFSTEGKGEIVGYVAYLKLLDGFEKTVYWSKDMVIAHAKKYSKAYGSGSSPWDDKDQFHAMAKKTVLKNTIAKWGIMSIEMEKAQIADQAVIHDVDTIDVDYVDGSDVDVETKKQELKAKDTKPEDLP